SPADDCREIHDEHHGDYHVCDPVPVTIAFPEPQGFFVENSWGTPEALADIDAARDNGCEPAFTVMNSCILTEVGEVCEGHPAATYFHAPPFDLTGDIPVTASRVQVDYSTCAPTGGIETNPADGSGYACSTLEGDPACSLVASVSLDEEGVTEGIWEDTYLCTESTTISSSTIRKELVCPGPIRGLGDEFIDLDYETNTNFAEVAAHVSAVEFAASDTDCGTPDDPVLDASQCRIFNGERRTCKVAFFGIQNCCEAPDGVSLADYMSLAFAMVELNSKTGLLDTGPIRGAWEYVSNPFVNAWTYAEKTFASGFNSLTGTEIFSVDDVAAKGLQTVIGEQLVQKAAEWTLEVFGESAVNALFQSAAGGLAAEGGVLAADVVLGPLLQLAGTILSAVMIAYTVYQVFTLLVEIIWACTEDEFETAVQRQLKSCRYNGTYCANKILGVCLERRRSYCCYSSPLSRIMAQEIKRLNGLSWGSAEHPQCGGFSIEDFNTYDLSDINLDEWMKILADTGNLPDGDDWSVEGLTGTGRPYTGAMPAGVERLDIIDRTTGRTQQLDFESLNEAAHQDLMELYGE
ncbi:MAG: conjugal transfer protein TraN, partial [Pseudomonadota bacterium]